ncbi:hypothetical protein AXF42_Ash021603 [Apostasia shenzhenica]|uniref:Uncharacterized protein n=1 Tax=Apostasia shenzhenica TaxID=1088818 RepID=A0A2H9ZY43_9ASPA|nr:hypothetical protein AXF42_Ash021603 [Apostasia shenzhenica]
MIRNMNKESTTITQKGLNMKISDFLLLQLFCTVSAGLDLNRITGLQVRLGVAEGM